MRGSDKPLIGIDTSGSFCSVAIRNSDGHISSLCSSGSGDHFEQLPRLVERVCLEGATALSDLHGVRIGVGPGSFTGLRIGMSFAKGLALALQIPLTGCSSLAAAAAAAFNRDSALHKTIVVADARREEVFAAVYVDGQPITEEVAPHIVEAVEIERYMAAFGVSRVIAVQQGLSLPSVTALAEHEIARGILLMNGEGDGTYKVEEIAVLEPTYLREVAAKTIEERKLKA